MRVTGLIIKVEPSCKLPSAVKGSIHNMVSMMEETQRLSRECESISLSPVLYYIYRGYCFRYNEVPKGILQVVETELMPIFFVCEEKLEGNEFYYRDDVLVWIFSSNTWVPIKETTLARS